MPPLLERRRPRASFTRVLERFCTRLDAGAIFTVRAPKSRFRPAHTGTVRITSLLVVGSYARGASTCGDLDLLFDFELLEGTMPTLRFLTRQVFGNPPDVRFYQGSAQRNTAGIAFGDCVPVWFRGAQWQAALAAIAPNPNASPHRSRDDIPLRIEQVYGDLTERQRLTELKTQGILNWRLIPYEGGTPPEPLTQTQARIARLAAIDWGKKSSALLPDLLRYVGSRYPCLRWDCRQRDIKLAGVVMQLGYRRLDESLLDRVDTARVLIAPHISRRGPNALWEIERGPCHPLELTFANCEAYVLCEPNANPSFVSELSDHSRSATLLELFPTADAARSWDEYLRSNEEDPQDPLEPMALRGRALLDLLSYADILEVIADPEKVTSYYLTREGLRIRKDFCDGEDLQLATPAQIVDALAAAPALAQVREARASDSPCGRALVA